MTSSIQQPNGAPEEPVRVNHTVRNIIIAAIVVVLVAVGGFFGLRVVNGSKTADAKGTESNPVKIGVVGATDPQWVEFQKKAKEAGLYVKIVDFQDYTSENPAVDSGELDLNEFQHLLYLANYNGSAADRRCGHLPAGHLLHQIQGCQGHSRWLHRADSQR